MDKLVSVIIPAYNHEKYIKDAINSVLNQTYKNIEVIVEDDCSTDNTAKEIKKIKDKRLKAIFSKKNKGPVRTMNHLMSLCKGDYIAILGSDDIWYPEKLEKQLKYFKNKNIGAVFTMMDYIDDNGKVIEDEELYKIFEKSNMGKGERMRFFYEKGNHLCHPTSIITRKAYEEIGEYNCVYKQLHDYEYWIRLANKFDIQVIDEKLIGYRKLSNGKNLSSSTDEHLITHINEEYSIIQKMFKIIDNKVFIEGFHNQFRNKESSSNNELICEKYLLLLKLKIAGAHNHFIALNYLSTLDNCNEIIDMLEKKYNYKLSNLYKDNSKINEFYNINLLVENHSELKKYKQANDELIRVSKELKDIYNSKSWKLTKPLRSIMGRIKK